MNETGYVHRTAQEQRSDPVLPGGWGRSAWLAVDGWPQPGPGEGLAGSGSDGGGGMNRAWSDAPRGSPPREVTGGGLEAGHAAGALPGAGRDAGPPPTWRAWRGGGSRA